MPFGSPRTSNRRSAPRNSPQPGGDALERQAELEADRDRRQRVLQVVAARARCSVSGPSVTSRLRRVVGAARAALDRGAHGQRTELDVGRGDVRVGASRP